MRRIGFIVLLLQLMQVRTDDVVSYAKCKVYKVTEKGLTAPIKNIPEGNISMLSERHESDNSYTVRSYLVPSGGENAFRRLLYFRNADYSVPIEDLGREIEEERNSNEGNGRRSFSRPGYVAAAYYSYDQLVEYLTFLSAIKNPRTNKTLAVVDQIGPSEEGRMMHLVKISADHNANNPVILLEAGIHAREWTSPATALYVMHQLVENYTHNADILDNIDFYIIPLSNPDGYEYSRTKDRLWRKTRSRHGNHYGVDGNRNFAFHWAEKGTSKDPESNIYTGPYPFSEKETRHIRDVGKKYKKRINVYVAIHAYGPCIVFPWSYNLTAPAPQSNLMAMIGNAAARAIRGYSGTDYKVGNSAQMMYPAAGGSDDYFKGVLGVDLSFTMELSPGGEGTFITSPSSLPGVVAEAFEGLKVMAEFGAAYRKAGCK